MRKQIIVIGPLVIDDGRNHRLDDYLNPSLYAIELRAGAFHGVKQNGVQIDPASPPANMTLTAPGIRFAGPDFTIEIKEPLPVIGELRQALDKGGDDAWDAWLVMVDIIQSSGVGLAYPDFVAAYSVEVADNFTYHGALFTALKSLLHVGWGWAEARDWIRGKDRDQLTGEETEVVEVWR